MKYNDELLIVSIISALLGATLTVLLQNSIPILVGLGIAIVFWFLISFEDKPTEVRKWD